MDYSEKRNFQRMALDCSMEYQSENESQTHQGKVINLSAKGVLFIATDEISAGEKLKLTLTPVHDITPPMLADIVVARCDKQSEDEFQIAAEIVQIH